MTRCQIWFLDGEWDKARPSCIYQHADGYSDGEHGIIKRLRRLFNRLAHKPVEMKELRKIPHPHAHIDDTYKSKTMADYTLMFGTRTTDSEWAAAEYVSMYREPMAGNVYVAAGMHGDEAYKYVVKMFEDHWIVEQYTDSANDEKYEHLEKTFRIGSREQEALCTNRTSRT